MNELTNDQLRSALKIMVKSGQIKRYRYPLFNDEFKSKLSIFTMGVLSGFVMAFLLIAFI